MKTKSWKKLMVAVRDFDRSSQKLLNKAAALAQRFGSTLEVVHVSSNAIEAFNIPGLLSAPNSSNEIAKIQLQRLEKMVRPLFKMGIAIQCSSVFDHPPADGIVRQVLKHNPDLLIIQSQRHGEAARIFLSNTDWELIRNCPCPLWIVKKPRLKPSLSVLAAIDPFHEHAKPANLDNEILNAAGRSVGTGAGRFGLCHAYTTPQSVVTALGEAALIPATPAEARRYKKQVIDTTGRVSKQYAIARKDQLVIEGDPADSIPAIAKRWKADLLVMGAVSRRGLKRIFIGNTAERVLDAVNCDLLVIKPRDFKCPVPRKAP
ncbi:MAG: universal stress protein [Steroidobacteraceae bacterium]